MKKLIQLEHLVGILEAHFDKNESIDILEQYKHSIDFLMEEARLLDDTGNATMVLNSIEADLAEAIRREGFCPECLETLEHHTETGPGIDNRPHLACPYGH